MHLQAVLFDLDNTLIDFMRMKRLASDAAARAMVAAGADFPFAAEEAGDILFGEYLDDIEGETVFSQFLKKHHQQRLMLSQHMVDKITAAAVNAYLRIKLVHTEPYPGIARTLLKLTRMGLRLGLVTDAPRFKAYQRLEMAGLVDYFDFVLTRTDHGEEKPHERPFREALDLLDLPPQAVLMVGDWPEKDVRGAKSVGMLAAWARYGQPLAEPPKEADFVLEQASDLVRFAALRTKAEA